MCRSRKHPYPSIGWSLGIPEGVGVCKAKIFKGKYKATLEFLEGWGWGQRKKTILEGEGHRIFSGITQ